MKSFPFPPDCPPELRRTWLPLEDTVALRLAVDEATQCDLCGEYDLAHLPQCPITRKKARMSQYRVVFRTNPPGVTDDGPHSVDFKEAPSMHEAMAKVMLEHDNCTIIAARLEGPALTPEEQRDGLIRAIRPVYTVLRALLDNPSAEPLFTPEMRKQLESMLAEAVTAMKAAGVTR